MIDFQLIEEFKEKSFLNAIRLFLDSTLLFTKDRYPSSLTLAVAAYEELGKVHVIDRACDAITLNPEGANDLFDMYFKSPFTTDHRHKQLRAFADANRKMLKSDDPLWPFIESGGMEQSRQQALYVEMTKKKILTPTRITREKAFKIIKLCYEGFKGTEDLAFSGFTAVSTEKSEWLATQAFNDVKIAFQRCSQNYNRA